MASSSSSRVRVEIPSSAPYLDEGSGNEEDSGSESEAGEISSEEDEQYDLSDEDDDYIFTQVSRVQNKWK